MARAAAVVRGVSTGRLRQARPVPIWKKAIYGIAEQAPSSRGDWGHKPHFARLICICVGCLLLMVVLIALIAVALTLDQNECRNGDHDCSPDAECTNLDGTFTCDCNEGYLGNGRKCKDVDECSGLSHGCSDDANCVNTPGAFMCVCKEGYRGSGTVCSDENECLEENGGCGDATFYRCVNLLGVPRLCKDVLECLVDNGGCGNSSRVACNERDGAAPSCTDVNECGVAACQSGFRCTNLDGACSL
jgi:hypothetical protein